MFLVFLAFRIRCTTMVDAKNLITQFRAETTRLQAPLRRTKLHFRHFRVSLPNR